MASPDPVGTPEQVSPPFIGTPDHKASPVLEAPPGWQKKISSSKKGSKREVWFITPGGQDIKSKKALDGYLKDNPGAPAASKFDWSTGETPTRRSSRLSTKTRPSLDSPKGASAEKRRKRKVEDSPKDGAEGGSQEPTAESAPFIDLKLDEVMEGAAAKAEDNVSPVFKTDAHVEKSPERETPTIEEIEMDLEKIVETAVALSGAQTDPEAENEQNLYESGPSLPSNEGKESNVFQHCPEAPNASRSVDVNS